LLRDILLLGLSKRLASNESFIRFFSFEEVLAINLLMTFFRVEGAEEFSFLQKHIPVFQKRVDKDL
jgi:hypothetical protein